MQCAYYFSAAKFSECHYTDAVMSLRLNFLIIIGIQFFTKMTPIASFTSIYLLSFCRMDVAVQSVTALLNPLKPKDSYSGRTAPLTSKRCILYIYSTNICTEYFKHGIYSPFLSLLNAVCFIILTYLVPVLFTFYIQGVLKLKKIIPAPNG